MRLKLAMSATAALAAVGLLAACSSSSTPGNDGTSGSSGGATGGGSRPLVGVDYPRSDSDFWNAYINYVPEKADTVGVDLKTTNSQNDISKLADNVQTLVAQGVKGVVMAPQDTAAIIPTLQQLASKNIPVVSIDTRPDSGKVYMVVRADNRAYGTKACKYIGDTLGGKGNVVMFEGDLASINGRDRTEAFNDCMKSDYPNIKVFGEPTKWDPPTAVSQLNTVLAGNTINAIYMQASIYLPSTLQALQQKGLLKKRGEDGHIVIVSNDGVPAEFQAIKDGTMDATVSQPADLYAQYGLQYVKDAIDGKKYTPGDDGHGGKIVQVSPEILEDQIPAPLVTVDGKFPESVAVDDTTLWGNNVS
ncbi:sugar ABC transporter substrate-binding protein [Cellulomonas sp. McL0617]|uniref:sugar ABC transporter substrate-binding protein n=1 Tax=Cellulomonas sp. McL0617 TaxID=3415675 RepID=UPI003CF4F905